MNTKTRASNAKPTRDRARQEEWRSRVPEARRIVEDVAPAIWDDVAASRVEDVPQPWKELVAAMRAEVCTKADTEARERSLSDDETVEQLRGYYWAFKVGRVADMLKYLLRTIRQDIGFEEGATLASMVLLEKAVLQVDLELQDGGSKEGREDRDENRHRVLEALKALTPRFDDVHMLRLRALQVAESSVKMTRIASDDDAEASVRAIAELDDSIDLERHRDFIKHEQPAMLGVLARSWLVEVDKAFANLDPLVVLEEFAEAQTNARGGKVAGGDGRVGSVRAVARLAMMCGALGFQQQDGEDFDAAVDRARANLLMTRSRFRKALRAFPGSLESTEAGGDTSP